MYIGCMETRPAKAIPVYMAITALIGWFALGLQLYLIIKTNVDAGKTVLYGIINFFSFFTILSNILVALSFTLSLLWPSSLSGRFFSRTTVRSAICLYILVVGIVYSLVLRQIWDPQGWQLVADRLLHDAIPLIYVVFWLLFVTKGVLQWKNTIPWLIFPLIYLVYSLLRGAVTGWYAYPFINVAELGFSKVLLNIMIMLAAFLGVGLFLTMVNRSMKKA